MTVTFAFLHYQKKRIRKEVKHQLISGLDKEELHLLVFTPEETRTKLRWKHSKEFEYNDHMYDIVESAQKDDKVFYWCWPDKQETKINKLISDSLINALGKDPQRKQQNEKLTNFLKTLYFSNQFIALFQPVGTHSKPGFYLDNFLSITSSPPVPPPQAA